MGSFGEKVQEIREAKRLGLRKLAMLAEISPSYLSRIESGKARAPQAEVAQRLAVALGENPEEWMASAHQDRNPTEAEAVLKVIFDESLLAVSKKFIRERMRKLRERDDLSRALSQLNATVLEGLRHGRFDFSLSCRSEGDGDRQFTIHAGKVYVYKISLVEILAKPKPGQGATVTEKLKKGGP